MLNQIQGGNIAGEVGKTTPSAMPNAIGGMPGTLPANGVKFSNHAVERMQTLNAAYSAKFGFPFIIAVKGLDRDALLARLEDRLGNPPEVEREEALRQVGRIGALRLEALIAD